MLPPHKTPFGRPIVSNLFCIFAEMKEWITLEIHAGLGGRMYGAHLGIDALKVSTEAYRFFRRCKTHKISAGNTLWHEKEGSPHARHIQSIYQLLNEISTKTQRLVTKMQPSSLLFVFSGDHSSAAGTIAGLRRAHPQKKIGVVWIDAHADLQTPYTTNSGYVHGMALSIAFQEDNMAQRVNEPLAITQDHWDKAKSLGVHQSAKNALSLAQGGIVFIGLRDIESAEDALIRQYNLPVLTVEDVRKNGAKWVVDKALSHLLHCDIIYVSFDVDSLDPTISVGTGTPAAGGLLLDEARVINEGLVASQKTQAWEMTEINPLLDKQNAMGSAGCEVLQAVASVYEKRKHGRL